MSKPNLNFDPSNAPLPPLRADQRFSETQQDQARAAMGATPSGLVASTLKAALAAVAILILFVLPAEYGIDPTRVGSLLGLTEMGEIKQQLADEAAAETATPIVQTELPDEVGTRLAAIETRLADIAAVVGVGSAPTAPPPASTAVPTTPEKPVAEPQPETALQPIVEPAVEPEVAAPPPVPQWRDTFQVTLAPTEGIEVKLAMKGGETAEFEWDAGGAVLNHDTHGDGGGNSITYVQGRGVAGEADTLTAAFTGNHGWFWRNRTSAPVVLSLRVRGDYDRMITP